MKPRPSLFRRTLLALGLAALAGASGTAAAQAEPKVLNVLNWADYIGPDTIAKFEKETGIKVRYDTFDANETLHARLLAGRTGYDIVVPSSHFAKMQIDAGLFMPLDRALIPNWKNLDPDLLEKLSESDPGNKHVVTWLWSFVTIGINVDKVKAALGSTPMPENPLDLIFKPELASKVKGCGVHVLDSASEVIPVALLYAGKDGYSRDAKDYEAAAAVLKAARPNITRISSPGPINDLAQGNICVSLGYAGDFNIARDRAAEGKTGQNIQALIPPRGATLFFDVMAIPKDAKHPKNAHAFINFILRPEIHAELTNQVFYGNPNKESKKFVKPELAANPIIFPPASEVKKMAMPKPLDNAARRLQTRTFTNFKAGR